MTSVEKKTILLNSVFNFGASLVSMFVSVYLFIYTNSIPMMCLYIIIRIGLFPVFFILGCKLVKKYSFTLTYVLGLMLITIALIYALASGSLFERNPYYVLVAAAIVGSGEGFYYFSANSCNQAVSTPQSRADFLAYNGAFNTIGSVFAPVFVSMLMALCETEMKAYKTMLLVIIGVFLIVIVIATRINVKSDNEDTNIMNSLIPHDDMWKDHCVAEVFYGLRDSLGLNTMGLLVYNAAGDGGLYSKVQVLFSVITVLSYYFSKKLLNRERISKTFKVGVILKIISTYVILYIPNLFGAIAYGVINAFASAFYDNSFGYISANIIGHYRGEMNAKVVVRETYLSLGRCAGMAFVLLCYKLLPESMYLIVSVTILGLTPIVAERMMLKYKS